MRHLRLAVLAVALVPGPAESQILVPGDYPNLEAAIDAAPPGSTIVIQTQALQSPVVIDRPLTIIGDPVANIGTAGFCFPIGPSIQLSGLGSGVVTLAQVNLSQCSDYTPMPALLAGGGFSELYVFDSTLISSMTGITGYGVGSAAVSISVPFALFSGSTVVGGQDNIDDCTMNGFPLKFFAHPAIDAPASTVAVIDSTISGGSQYLQCCTSCACPSDLSVVGSSGGAGIVADQVLVSGGSVAGGKGMTIRADSTICGQTPDGPSVVSNDLDFLPGILTASGPIQAGSLWTLSYFTPGPSASLLLGLGFTMPIDIPGLGWLFVGPAFLPLGPVTVGAPDSITISVASDPYLIGFPLAFQIFDTSIGLTRPVLGVIVP